MPKEEEGNDYRKPNVKAIIDDAVGWLGKDELNNLAAPQSKHTSLIATRFEVAYASF